MYVCITLINYIFILRVYIITQIFKYVHYKLYRESMEGLIMRSKLFMDLSRRKKGNRNLHSKKGATEYVI